MHNASDYGYSIAGQLAALPPDTGYGIAHIYSVKNPEKLIGYRVYGPDKTPLRDFRITRRTSETVAFDRAYDAYLRYAVP